MSEVEPVGSNLPEAQANGYSLLANLEALGVITDTALVIDRELPFDQCDMLFAILGHAESKNQWLIGDLALYTEKVYGQTYAQAAIASGLSEKTLSNRASICARFPRSRRRRNLTFSHHAELAYLPPKKRDALLKQAADEGWTRELVRKAKWKHENEQRQLEEWRDEYDDLFAEAETASPLDSWLEERREIEEKNPRHHHEILPPAGQSEEHYCDCLVCGRRHRSDIDVE